MTPCDQAERLLSEAGTWATVGSLEVRSCQIKEMAVISPRVPSRMPPEPAPILATRERSLHLRGIATRLVESCTNSLESMRGELALARRTQTKERRVCAIEQETSPALDWLNISSAVMFGLCVVLFYPPYFRGLFFPREQLITLLATLVLFMLWWVDKWRRNDFRYLSGPLDYAALALVGAYVLSTAVAINQRSAIQEILKNLNYFLIYWLVAELLVRRGKLNLVLHVLLLSALGVAVTGVGAAAGTIHYNGAFAGERISSTLQYPNSLAAYLTAAMMISMTLAVQAQTLWRRLIYVGITHFLFLPFVLTYSRGAWLLLPFVIVLLILMLPRGSRLRATLCFGVVFLGSSASLPLFSRGLALSRAPMVWGSYLVGLPLVAVLTLAAEGFLRLRTSWKVAVAGTTVLLVVGALGIWVSAAVAKPLVLTHGPGEKNSSKTVKEVVTSVRPRQPYQLILEATTTGPADKDAWQVTIISYDAQAQPTTLLDQRGTTSNGWMSQHFEFQTLPTTDRLLIQLLNYYAGTGAAFRNVRLVPVGSPAGARDLMFWLARLLPQGLADRVLAINPQAQSFRDRIFFTKDALKIVRDHPLFGVGGGGWASIYFKYQSFGYSTTQVHNHFAQTWVETGTVGFVSLLGLWMAFGYTWWRAYQSSGAGERTFLAGLGAAIVALGAHSSVDFNLSLGAVSFYFWALVGATRGLGAVREGLAASGQAGTVPRTAAPRSGSQRWVAPISLGLSGGVMILAASLLVGFTAGERGARSLTRGNIKEAETALRRAVSYDPWTASYHLDLGQELEFRSKRESRNDLLAEADQHMKKGLALDRFNPQYNAAYGAYCLRNGRIEEGLAYLERALEYQPFQVRNYENLSNAYVQVARYLLQRGEVQKAVGYATSAIGLSGRLASHRASRPAGAPPEAIPPANTPQLALWLGQAFALRRQFDQATAQLQIATQNEGTRAEALLWLGLVAENQGHSADKERLLAEAVKLRPTLQGEYQVLWNLLAKPK